MSYSLYTTPPAPPFWKFTLGMRTFLPCHVPDRWSRGTNRILPDLAFGFVHKRSGNEINLYAVSHQPPANVVFGVNNLEKNGVLSLPWDKTGTQRLVYDGEGVPPCQVIVQQPGTLKCSCPKFKSAMICAHSLAVAEEELCLPEILALVGKKKNEPDRYQLVGNDLPKSAGDKSSQKGKAKLTRKEGH